MKLISLLPLSLFALQAVGAFYRPGHSFSGSLLLQYLSWNEVPNEVYLGLLSGNQGVKRTQLINGSCFIYEPHEFERCKYYSDCCAMTPARPREQLAPGTFSCHSGFYLVDKCPDFIQDQLLRERCEGTEESGKPSACKIFE